jgi:hypothetical protein
MNTGEGMKLMADEEKWLLVHYTTTLYRLQLS